MTDRQEMQERRAKIETREALAAKLETQKDGRLFASGLIRRMEQRWAESLHVNGSPSDFSAESITVCEGEEVQVRDVPQSAILLRAYDELQSRGTREAVLGFFAILTDFIGSHIAGAPPAPDSYARMERARRFDAWGTVRRPREVEAARADGAFQAFVAGVLEKPKKGQAGARRST